LLVAIKNEVNYFSFGTQVIMKKQLIFLAMSAMILGGFQAANAQGLLNKIKKKTEEVTKPAQTTNAVSSNKINVKDVFREAAPALRITAAENADKVITQSFESENRIAFTVPENLAISAEGTTRVYGEAKVFPTKNGGGLFVITFLSCHAAIGCGAGAGQGLGIQMFLIENGNAQLVTGLHLASYMTTSDAIVSKLKANKSYKKPIQATYNPSYNLKDNKLNVVVDCDQGVCTNAFVVRSLSFDGERFIEVN
jgi:hypothetical protein